MQTMSLAGDTQQLCVRCSDGCHHCGRRTGDVIADHIPPNVKVRCKSSGCNLGHSRPSRLPPPHPLILDTSLQSG